jgi:TRAP-type mannitol/chloroaromatic compound transport system substrate-binding protein
MPSFHEPGPGLEVIINKQLFSGLPKDLQEIVRVACSACANESLAEFQYHNIQSFEQLSSKYDVEVRQYPDDVVEALAKTTRDVLEDMSKADPMTAKVHASFMDFLKKAHAYNKVMDQRMLRMREIAFG